MMGRGRGRNTRRGERGWEVKRESGVGRAGKKEEGGVGKWRRGGNGGRKGVGEMESGSGGGGGLWLGNERGWVQEMKV